MDPCYFNSERETMSLYLKLPCASELYDELYKKIRFAMRRLQLAFYGEAPYIATVYNWFNEFKLGLTTLTDDLREGSPSTATTINNINTDKRVAYQQISTSLGIGGLTMPEWKGRVPLTRSHCERITVAILISNHALQFEPIMTDCELPLYKGFTHTQSFSDNIKRRRSRRGEARAPAVGR
ncbi:hypothetical protein EVAR_94154_1 [Eumeta japonica]|uniref:Mos1 transposase HTH domain-containing protein n=1 Tax=Eumeta variegata TaxID=151549 RepID=A0A4C1U860_EUMVA|nr:hypothetical protein EVAR_94154_1 [Eumeta japonica]